MRWNYVTSCLPAVALTLKGSVHLKASNGSVRYLDADRLLLGSLETARSEDELLVPITFKNLGRRAGGAYKKWETVADSLPVIGVCALVVIDGSGICTSIRVGLSGLLSGATISTSADEALIGTDGDRLRRVSASSRISSRLRKC